MVHMGLDITNPANSGTIAFTISNKTSGNP